MMRRQWSANVNLELVSIRLTCQPALSDRLSKAKAGSQAELLWEMSHRGWRLKNYSDHPKTFKYPGIQLIFSKKHYGQAMAYFAHANTRKATFCPENQIIIIECEGLQYSTVEGLNLTKMIKFNIYKPIVDNLCVLSN